MALANEQISALQTAYSDLINYDSDDATTPIDPRTYQTPDGDRLIHIAALRGDVDTIKVLLKAGEDINAAGDMNNTPAHYAAAGKWQVLFDFLLQNGADPSLENEFGLKPGAVWR